MMAPAADGCKHVLGRNRSENRPNVTVRVRLLGIFPAQLRLDFQRARARRQQTLRRQFRILEDLRKSTAVCERAGARLDVDQVITQNLEIQRRRRQWRLIERITEHAEEISFSNIRELTEKKLKIEKELEHEVFVDDVRPVLRLDIRKKRRTEYWI